MGKKLMRYDSTRQIYPYTLCKKSDFKSSDCVTIKPELKYRCWYIIYLVTATLVLFSTVLLLIFGLGESGDSLIGDFGLKQMADKVINSVVEIAFGNFAGANEHAPSIPNSDFENINQSGGQIVDKPPFEDNQNQKTDIYDFDYSAVPEGYTPIIPMDLSLQSYGMTYVNNSTGYAPAVEHLLNKKLFDEDDTLYSPDQPRVLVLHTHSTESYSSDNAVFCESVDTHGRSNDKAQNVIAIGKIISDMLNQQGMWAVHCTVMHDATQYKDSYANAAETIKKYLEKYPSIELVIDVHRDAVIKSSGEIVRAVSEVDGKAAAQVMCVVGSDFGGEDCPGWEDNLALAQKLRSVLNDSYENLCRPTSLKSSTYNQEFSKYSLLLEIGTSGNSLEEAEISAELVAKAIAEILK